MESFRAVLLFTLACTPLFAQQPQFGRTFPLTNTRYDATTGTPVLASNGKDAFLFWQTAQNIRFAPWIAGEKPIGRVVMSNVRNFTVVWAGTHFLVAGERGDLRSPDSIFVVGRILSSAGEPLGNEFTLRANARKPRLAFNGSNLLMLYVSFEKIEAISLTAGGLAAGSPFVIGNFHWLTITGNNVEVDYAVAANASTFAVTVAGREVELLNFAPDGNLRSRQTITGTLFENVLPRSPLIAAGANNQFLAIWIGGSGGDDRLFGSRISSTGSPGTPFAIQRTLTSPLAIAAASNRYEVLFVTPAQPFTATLAHIETSAIRYEAIDVTDRTGMAALVISDRTLVAWTKDSAIYGRDLTNAKSEVLAYGALEQSPAISASINDVTFVAWNESDGAHFGVRNANGDWTEQSLGIGTFALAAGAGASANLFVLIVSTPSGIQAMRFLANGQSAGTNTTITGFSPRSIAWSGSQFALIGMDAQRNILAALLSPAGVALPAAFVARDSDGMTLEKPVIASNGSQFLAAWVATERHNAVPFPVISGTGIYATRLNTNLQRLDATNIEIAEPSACNDVTLVWEGSRYLAAWTDYYYVFARRIYPSAALDNVVIRANPFAPSTQHTGTKLTTVPGGAALVWHQQDPPADYVAVIRGETVTPLTSFSTGASSSAPEIATNGTAIAYLVTATQDAAPYYGSARVMMALADAGLPSPPEAPRATLRQVGPGLLLLEWTAPPQEVNGYRIEVQVGPVTWGEIESWFVRGSRSLYINALRVTTYSFRVRAWNDAGVSTASNEASVYVASKRRSTR